MKQINFRRISYWKLKLFCEAYTSQNYTQAGENIGTSQTNVTKAIADLEQITGKTLFIKTAKEMLPTNDAIELFAKIQEGLSTIENALSDDEDPMKTLAIAGNHSVCCTVFPVTLRTMKDSGFNINYISVYNTDYQNAISLLRRQIIHAAMFPLSEVPNDLTVHATATSDSVLLVHKDHHFLQKENITMEDLKKENFLLIDDYKINAKYRDYFKDFYENNAFQLVNTDWEIIMHFVGQNLGICPFLDVPLTNPNICKIPAQNIIPPVVYSIVTYKKIQQKYLSVLKVFIDNLIVSLKPSTYTL